MLRFCGFGLELAVDSLVSGGTADRPVWTATDHDGGHWLIVEATATGAEPCWLCAPVSIRASDLVAAGRAEAADAVRHSATGWVEVVTVVEGHAVPDRRVRCSDLPPFTAVEPLIAV